MRLIGCILFIISWPVHWLYALWTKRVRVAIAKDNKILLVKHWIGMDIWQLPGGGIKKNESLISAAKREIKEELNVDINEAEVLNEKYLSTPIHGLSMRYQYVVAKVSDDSAVDPNWEISEYDWFDFDNLPNVAQDVNVAVELINKK
jgi:8-oxo-dGTP pyrophosphatase MutT (NUDIX family)